MVEIVGGNSRRISCVQHPLMWACIAPDCELRFSPISRTTEARNCLRETRRRWRGIDNFCSRSSIGKGAKCPGEVACQLDLNESCSSCDSQDAVGPRHFRLGGILEIGDVDGVAGQKAVNRVEREIGRGVPECVGS